MNTAPPGRPAPPDEILTLPAAPARRPFEEDDEPTTVAPLMIDERKVVVVPANGSSDRVRSDLRGDPDVQEALRWLDPPKTPPPEMIPVQHAEYVAAPPGMYRVPAPYPTPRPAPYPPPDGTPATQLPPDMYAYVPSPDGYLYATPQPAPYPTLQPGGYATPIPHYIPSGYHTPIPGSPHPPVVVRSPLPWILATALVMGGGVALGWLLFAGGNRGAPATAAAEVKSPPAVATEKAPDQASSKSNMAPALAPQPPTPPLPAPAPDSAAAPDSALAASPDAPDAPIEASAAPPEKAAGGQPAEPTIRAKVTKVIAAESSIVEAPVSGEVRKVYVRPGAVVAKGDKLLEITRQGNSGAQARKLAARVAELEQLAKTDPVYEDFLADARRDHAAAKGKSKTIAVVATAAGEARMHVSQGDRIASGKRVAEIATGGEWTLKASVKAGSVTEGWKCSLAFEAQRAPCTIAEVRGSRITAHASEESAPWLANGKKLELVLDPP